MADKGCTEITEGYELTVVECDSCGFHLGIDASWLEQTTQPGLEMKCPECRSDLFIEAAE